MAANDRQIGGGHYKKGGEEHWDRAWRLKYDPFQYIITKWVERWRDKGGVEDLKKAQHAIEKYIEVAQIEMPVLRHKPAASSVGMEYMVETPAGPIYMNSEAVFQWLDTLMSNLPELPGKTEPLQPGHIVNYGPNPLVKPDGWVGFVFEGVDAYGALFTCRQCKAQVRCPADCNPHAYHAHDGAEPDHRYTNQD